MTKRATFSLRKVKSCNALLRVLLVCISSWDHFWIHVFKFGYPSSPHPIFTWARTWGSVFIFRSQKGSASKNLLGEDGLEECCMNRGTFLH